MRLRTEFPSLSDACISFRKYTTLFPDSTVLLVFSNLTNQFTIHDPTEDPEDQTRIDNVNTFAVIMANAAMCEEIVNGLILGNDDGH